MACFGTQLHYLAHSKNSSAKRIGTQMGVKQGENFPLWMMVDIFLIGTTLIMAHFSYALIERRVLSYKNYFSMPAKQADLKDERIS